MVSPFVAASLIPVVAGLTLIETTNLSAAEIVVSVADVLTILPYVYFVNQLAREEQGILTRLQQRASEFSSSA